MRTGILLASLGLSLVLFMVSKDFRSFETGLGVFGLKGFSSLNLEGNGLHPTNQNRGDNASSGNKFNESIIHGNSTHLDKEDEEKNRGTPKESPPTECDASTSAMKYSRIVLRKPLYGRTANQLYSFANAIGLTLRIQAKYLAIDGSWEKALGGILDLSHVNRIMMQFNFSLIIYQGEAISKESWVLDGEMTFTQKGIPVDIRDFIQPIYGNFFRPHVENRNMALKLYLPFRNRTVVSVHRRRLEGECFRRATAIMKSYSYPSNAFNLTRCCNYSYDDIQEIIQEVIGNFEANTIALFVGSDGQDRLGDDQMRKIAAQRGMQIVSGDSTLGTDLWMMAVSDIHIANPASSISRVIHAWRRFYGRKDLAPTHMFKLYAWPYPPLIEISCRK